MPNSNIIDYVREYGSLSFKDRSFGAEDALVLCQFAYLKFDTVVGAMSEEAVTLSQLAQHENRELLFLDKRYEKSNRALFDAMLESKRFMNLKMCMYINRVEEETQFAAITFILPCDSVLIVFRGTDETIVGWQEDMGLALNKPIQGQTLSARYINDVSERFSGNFMLAGHSKGGNLAVYSALFASEKAKERITCIYCLDSPGFRTEFLEESGYALIADRIEKIIPKSSFVGMLFDDAKTCRVIDAHSVGVLQHNPFMWVIKDGYFEDKYLTKSHETLIKTVNEWILDKSEEELERFVNFLNKMMSSGDADTTIDFSAELLKNTILVIKAANELDDDTKHFLSEFMKSYFEIAREMLKEEREDRRLQKKKR